MPWHDIRQAYPGQWLILEVLESHSMGSIVIPDRLAVIEQCTDASKLMSRYSELHASLPGRFLCFAHTGRATLEFEERFSSAKSMPFESEGSPFTM